MSEKIAVYVAWPYANGDLHLGHIAGAYLPADIFSRYHRLAGHQVSMISGSDSYGTPITLKAKQMGITPFELVTQYHLRFLEDFQALGISFNLFTYTLTENHSKTVSEIFSKLDSQGDFEIISQAQFFDEQEQMFLPDRYVNGTCPLCGNDKARGDECEQCGKTYDVTSIKDPKSTLSGTTPILKDTEHFFFKMEKYQSRLKEYIAKSTHWKNHVQNFTLSWIDDGLKPRAITRDIDWGIKVPKPGWESKVIYVWFDAVIGYFSASKELSKLSAGNYSFEDFWYDSECKSYYFIGKDNIPFHTVIWPIELMAYDEKLNLPYDVPANHFLNIEGNKFSTSRGYAVWVRELLEQISPDALRYYVCSILPETKDSNFSWDELKLKNNGELVAAWGNLVNRVLGFCQSKFQGVIPEPLHLNEIDKAILERRQITFDEVSKSYEACNLREALKQSMSLVREVNKYLDDRAPWTLFKTSPEDAGTVINVALSMIRSINLLLSPVLPFSCQIVEYTIGGDLGNLYSNPEIKIMKDGAKEHSILYMDVMPEKDKFSPIDVEAGKVLPKIEPLFKLME